MEDTAATEGMVVMEDMVDMVDTVTDPTVMEDMVDMAGDVKQPVFFILHLQES